MDVQVWELNLFRVACGIFVGFILNFIFSKASDNNFALALILGAPVVPSIVLLIALAVCPESPRYYLRRGPKYNPEKAYAIIKTLRRCEVGLPSSCKDKSLADSACACDS